VIALARNDVRPFAATQINLVRTFADQAAIAIENTRLFNETKESLERQTAVSDILKVISSSPTDIQPVLEAIASSAARFTGAEDASVLLVRGDVAQAMAHFGPISLPGSVPVDRSSVSGTAIVEARVVHVEDVTADETYPVSRRLSIEKDGQRTVLAAPLIRDGKAIGTISLRRREARLFTERQVDLVRVFADQAVIAIENVRLFNETKEALAQQTATAEVLQVISHSAFDLSGVFRAMLERAVSICSAEWGSIQQLDGDALVPVEQTGGSAEWRALNATKRYAADRGTVNGRALLEKRTIHLADVREDAEYRWSEGKNIGAYRTALVVPTVSYTHLTLPTICSV